MRIYLIRHGETLWNYKGIFRGRADIGLNDNGLDQADRLGRALKDSGIEKIYSSPLKRAFQTSEMITKHINAEIVIDNSFQNINIGFWEGMQKEKVKQEFPKEWDLWLNNPEKLKIPGGESIKDVKKRSVKRIKELVHTKHEIIAISTHRSVLKTIMGGILNIKGNYFWKIRMDNCSINIMEYNERGFILTKLNDTNHLENVLIEKE